MAPTLHPQVKQSCTSIPERANALEGREMYFHVNNRRLQCEAGAGTLTRGIQSHSLSTTWQYLYEDPTQMTRSWMRDFLSLRSAQHPQQRARAPRVNHYAMAFGCSLSGPQVCHGGQGEGHLLVGPLAEGNCQRHPWYAKVGSFTLILIIQKHS